jgi:tRNA threonylcarbamoyladenosine biosynthesis protein TsaB
VKILALETTERVGTVAAAEDANVLRQLSLDPALRSGQSLAPALVRVLAEVAWEPADVELVAVGIGPGSFTGLRLGVTVAKTFAYAAEADILGVDTLETIAAGVPTDVRRLAVAVDAQRGQVAAAVLARRDDGRFDVEQPMRLVDADAWLAGLPAGIAVAGPVLEKLKDRVPHGLNVVPAEFWHPTAANVARLAAMDYAAGRRDDLWRLAPHYSRRAAAEEKKP